MGQIFHQWLACVNAGQPVISPGASPARQAQNWLRPAHEMGSNPHTVRAPIASLGDGTADTDGWLTMTVHDGGFKHTAQKAEHISKGQSLPLLWWLVASALVPCLLDFLPMLVQSPTSPGEKREAL